VKQDRAFRRNAFMFLTLRAFLASFLRLLLAASGVQRCSGQQDTASQRGERLANSSGGQGVMISPIQQQLSSLLSIEQREVLPFLMSMAAMALIVYLAVKLVEEIIGHDATTFYPTRTQLSLNMWRVGTASLFKGSGWKRAVLSKDFRLNERALTKTLPLEPVESHIKDLIRVCELKDLPTDLPIMYPAILMIYPNCLLFTSPEYPFPAIGSVHVRNFTKIFRPLASFGEYTGRIRADPVVRAAKKGSEVCFVSSLQDKAGEVVWTNSSTYLVLHKRPQESAPKGATPEVAGESPSEEKVCPTELITPSTLP
jgi:hypothetical protein